MVRRHRGRPGMAPPRRPWRARRPGRTRAPIGSLAARSYCLPGHVLLRPTPQGTPRGTQAARPAAASNPRGAPAAGEPRRPLAGRGGRPCGPGAGSCGPGTGPCGPSGTPGRGGHWRGGRPVNGWRLPRQCMDKHCRATGIHVASYPGEGGKRRGTGRRSEKDYDEADHEDEDEEEEGVDGGEK